MDHRALLCEILLINHQQEYSGLLRPFIIIFYLIPKGRMALKSIVVLQLRPKPPPTPPPPQVRPY